MKTNSYNSCSVTPRDTSTQHQREFIKTNIKDYHTAIQLIVVVSYFLVVSGGYMSDKFDWSSFFVTDRYNIVLYYFRAQRIIDYYRL